VRARIGVLPDAAQQIEQAAAWWREHRTASPELFGEELAAAFHLLEEQPDAGRPFPRRRFRFLRVLLLPRTRYSVYYERDTDAGIVLVRAVWSAVRGRRPPLKR
jgi:plasmid stabilization system protein ParE